MKVCKNNYIEELRNIINLKAKYQKVMLLFDDNISNLEINKVYDSVKDLCIYNQINFKDLGDEIFNGYRLIIYYCKVESFLKHSFDRAEFINVFLPKDDNILPYFLSHDNSLSNNEDYLIIENNNVDFSFLASVNFNMFYNYFYNLTIGKHIIPNIITAKQEITQNNIINQLSNLSSDMKFIDIDIVKSTKINYDKIILVDLIVLDAFLLLINAIKNKNITLVDVYKTAKEDFKLIDKFYKMYYDETFINLIILNYNCLYNYCVKTKDKIKELICYCDVEKQDVDDMIKQLKDYAQNSDGLTAYMYLYNIFGS